MIPGCRESEKQKSAYNSHLALINKWCAKMCELKQMYIT